MSPFCRQYECGVAIIFSNLSTVRACRGAEFWRVSKKMTEHAVKGIFAAVLLPREADGRLDERALETNLEFLLEKGIGQFALNGATGEFSRVTLEESARVFEVTRRVVPAETKLLCGVGAGSFEGSLRLAEQAAKAGAVGLLAPPPYFFPYKQEDVEAFAGALAEASPVPVLLYNLPQFTSGYETATSLRLLSEHKNIIGVKDSSGSLETMRAMTQAGLGVTRIIGNDGALAQALSEGVCDGVVSGVACVLPEVIQALFANAPGDGKFEQAAALLKEFIAQIDVLPTPWGLKVVGEARTLAKARYALPVSAGRAAQMAEIARWFEGWYETFAASC